MFYSTNNRNNCCKLGRVLISTSGFIWHPILFPELLHVFRSVTRTTLRLKGWDYWLSGYDCIKAHCIIYRLASGLSSCKAGRVTWLPLPAGYIRLLYTSYLTRSRLLVRKDHVEKSPLWRAWYIRTKLSTWPTATCVLSVRSDIHIQVCCVSRLYWYWVLLTLVNLFVYIGFCILHEDSTFAWIHLTSEFIKYPFEIG